MKKNKILFITLSFLLIYNIVYPSKNNDLPNPNKFNWIYGPKSEEYYKFRSVIHLNKNEILLHGNDASDYYYLSQGVKNSQDFIYFTINDDKSENTTYVNYFKSGYISIEDWDSFDSLEVLSAIKQNTINDNKIRNKEFPKLFVDDWLIKPQLNKNQNFVYWVIQVHDEFNKNFYNARAIKLNREGYIVFNTVSKDPEQELFHALNAFSDSKNYAYSDFNPTTDTIAAFGIGALATKLLTGKSTIKNVTKAAGAGLFGIILVFLKKFWFIIFIPIIYLFKLLFNKK